MFDENIDLSEYAKAPLETKINRKEKSTFVCKDYCIKTLDFGDKKFNKLILNGEEVESGKDLKISEIRLIDGENKISEWGMWIRKNQRGAISYGAVVRFLMRFRLKRVGDVIGVEFPIVRAKNNYWMLDAV